MLVANGKEEVYIQNRAVLMFGYLVVLIIMIKVTELELELIQTQMAQKPMLRAEVGMRVRCANKASAE